MNSNAVTKDLIMAHMQRLMCLGYEGQPAAELIEGTGRLWVEKLSGYSPVRLAIAFDSIEKHRKSLRRDGGGWPSPGDIIAHLPTYAASTPLPVDTERQIAPDPKAAERIRVAALEAINEAKRLFGCKDVPEATT